MLNKMLLGTKSAIAFYTLKRADRVYRLQCAIFGAMIFITIAEIRPIRSTEWPVTCMTFYSIIYYNLVLTKVFTYNMSDWSAHNEEQTKIQL